MKTTIGSLVAQLFESYRRTYHDAQLAALATEVVVDELRAAAALSAPPAVRGRHPHRRAA